MGIAAAGAEGGGLAIADADLDVVEGAGVGGVEGEVEAGGADAGDAGEGEAVAEEAEGVGEQRALHQAGGDEVEGDLDGAGVGGDDALRDGLLTMVWLAVTRFCAVLATL